jgi:PilZ domain
MEAGIVIPFERRFDSRAAQMSRVVGLRFDGREATFAVHNLSSRGAMGRPGVPLAEGSKVTLIFEGGRTIPGMVQWARSGFVGIYFAIPLPLALLRRQHLSSAAQREARFAVSRAAKVHYGELARFAVIRNVSRHGLLIETFCALAPGQTVDIECGSIVLRECQVRWSRHGRVGLHLTTPLSLERFEEATADAGI